MSTITTATPSNVAVFTASMLRTTQVRYMLAFGREASPVRRQYIRWVCRMANFSGNVGVVDIPSRRIEEESMGYPSLLSLGLIEVSYAVNGYGREIALYALTAYGREVLSVLNPEPTAVESVASVA